MQPRAALALAFVSGFVALGYEILWARRLADVIGATSLAASLVVGVFFVLLAAGAIVLGPAAARAQAPWQLYARLEAGILLAVLPAFFGDRLAGAVAALLGDSLTQPGVGLAAKLFLALVFVGPASFLMGGTLPAMGQAVVGPGRLGREGNLIYGANTLGGALGILATTFAFLPALGMRRSFACLMLGSAALAGAALVLARRTTPDPVDVDRTEATPAPNPIEPPAMLVPRGTWLALAFASGFLVLGLEILSLHLFSQVLHNSTYTFATVLVVVIAALAIGALLLPRFRLDPGRALHGALLALAATAFAAALLPRVFVAWTHGLEPLGGGVASLAGYVLRALGAAALLLGPLFVCASFVFPLVLAGAGADMKRRIGARWGELLGVNAAGALAGAILANYFGMRTLGLWLSFVVWSALAIVVVILAGAKAPAAGRRLRLGFALAASTVLIVAFPRALPIAALAPGDRLLAWRAGADGVAAVVANPNDRRIKLNNTYSLGGIANAAQQARMGSIALLLHPQPKNVGFIGIATGITASAALRDPAVESVTSVELSPQVTALACEHFADANANLCGAERSRIVVEDGRLFFRATRATYDVVVGDLFVPWQAGTANLYTREQFEAVHERLSPGGLFAQWLPLFQLDAEGFWGIAATFTAVFPNAWLAIADFQPSGPALALIGWRDADGAPSFDVLAARTSEVQPLARLQEPMLADAAGVATFLIGPVAPALPPGIPLMTLDRPWLEHHAPRAQRALPERFFVGSPLVDALRRVADGVRDPALRAPVLFGQTLLECALVAEREGPERAAAWLDRHLEAPLPPANFQVENPGRMNWPFREAAGLVLLTRARVEAESASAPSPSGLDGRTSPR